MNRTLACLAFASLTLLTALGAGHAAPPPPPRVSIAQAGGPADDRLARTALDDFSFDVYRRLAAEASRNIFCSPYSIYTALAMCAEGARGETGLEMGRALRFPVELARPGDTLVPWSTAALHAALAALNQRFTAPSSGHELNIANALWVDRSCRLQKTYLDAIVSYYHGGIYGVGFRGGSARQQINTWTEKQTRGRIRELLSNVSPRTRMVITNAIYFKGDWAEPFEARQTKDEVFVLGGGNKVRTRTMIQASMDSVRYGAFEGDGTFFPTPHFIESGRGPQKFYPDGRGFSVLEMPYRGGELAMVLIVPRSENGLAALEQALSHTNVTKWTDQLEKRSTHVHVPKFRMETAYNMIPALQALGMKRAFIMPVVAGSAEFEGMTLDEAPDQKLYVGQVIHKAFVEVNEKGTEAAAATAVAMLATAAPPLGPVREPFTPTFRADRPFLFLIRDTKSSVVLFIGRVHDPRRKG